MIKAPGIGTEPEEELDIRVGSEKLCESYKIIRTGRIRCKTREFEMTEEQEVSINGITCSNPNRSKCMFKTDEGPEVDTTEIDVVAKTMRLRGRRFRRNMRGRVRYGGSWCTRTTIISEFEMTAYWEYGVPSSEEEVETEIEFESEDYDNDFFTERTKCKGRVRNRLPPPTSTPSSCGYGGGRSFRINARGLKSQLKSKYAKVNVCGVEAEFEEGESDENTV